MIEASEVLAAAAQVAVTLAGFAGVVVVFGRRAVHEWSDVEHFRLRLMLTTSASALVFSMVGQLLLATGLPERTVWGWSSGAAAVLMAVSGVRGLRTFVRFSAAELEAAGASRRSFYITSTAALASGVLLLYNVTTLRAFWPFFAWIVVGIFASTLQFVRIILGRPKAE